MEEAGEEAARVGSKSDHWSSGQTFSCIGVSKPNDSPCRIWVKAIPPMVQNLIQEDHTESYTCRGARAGCSLANWASVWWGIFHWSVPSISWY